MSCCPPHGAEPFTTGTARKDARRYRRRGLDRTGRRIVDLAAPDGSTVLEIGAGVGGLQVEVLRRGATRSVGVELSPTYEAQARALLAESGVADRAERLVADLRTDPAGPQSDVVLLHRVVCCTPDPAALLSAAGARARRRLVMSFPRDVFWLRSGRSVMNVGARLLGWGWRFYVHRPADLVSGAEATGLRLKVVERGTFWQIAVLEREPAGIG